MDSTNFQTILDKTFMLLEQAINEKKAEQAGLEHERESYSLKNEAQIEAKAGKPRSPKG